MHRGHRKVDAHTARCGGASPVVRVACLLVHDHGFEHGALAHHKLNHPVDEEQEVPAGKRGACQEEGFAQQGGGGGGSVTRLRSLSSLFTLN